MNLSQENLPNEKEQFAFNIALLNGICPTLPNNIDELWERLSSSAFAFPFSQTMQQLSNYSGNRALIEIFNLDISPDPFLADIQSRLVLFQYILPTKELYSFLLQPLLDPAVFSQSLSEEKRAIFQSCVVLFSKILSQISNYDDRIFIIHNFSQLFLAPIPERQKRENRFNSDGSNYSNQELISIRIPNIYSRPFLRYLFFIPAINEQGIKGILYIDRFLNLTFIDTNNQSLNEFSTLRYHYRLLPPAETGPLSNTIPNQPTINKILSISTDTETIISFGLIGDSASIEMLINSDFSDPYELFLICIPSLLKNDFIPELFYSQFVAFINTGQLDFSLSVAEAALSLQNNEILNKLTQNLAQYGTLPAFLRAAFGRDISNSQKETIFGINSLATLSANSILHSYGESFSSSFIQFLTKTLAEFPDFTLENLNDDNFSEIEIQIIKKSIEYIEKAIDCFPPQLKLVASCAIKSSRRKFGKDLKPLKAVSEIIFNRFLLLKAFSYAENLGNNGKTMKNIVQEIMNCFAFKEKEMEKVLDENDKRNIAKYLLTISKPINCSFVFQNTDLNELIKWIGENYKVISSFLQQKSDYDLEDPLIWSMIELVENCLTGVNENLDNIAVFLFPDSD